MIHQHITATRANILWRALWIEMSRLEDHPDNRKYRTGREAVLAEMRELRDMLAELNADHNIVSASTFGEMCAEYTFESPFTAAA